MQNKKIRRILYQAKHQYLTINNVVLAVAAVIAISWSWASVLAVQRNYTLQKEVDDKHRQEQLLQLETANLQYEQRYYKSREYLTLESKRRLGLAESGERVLILPPNTERARAADSADRSSTNSPLPDTPPPSPLQQWIDFLFGAKPKR